MFSDVMITVLTSLNTWVSCGWDAGTFIPAAVGASHCTSLDQQSFEMPDKKTTHTLRHRSLCCSQCLLLGSLHTGCGLMCFPARSSFTVIWADSWTLSLYPPRPQSHGIHTCGCRCALQTYGLLPQHRQTQTKYTPRKTPPAFQRRGEEKDSSYKELI